MTSILGSDISHLKFCDGCKEPMQDALLHSINIDDLDNNIKNLNQELHSLKLNITMKYKLLDLLSEHYQIKENEARKVLNERLLNTKLEISHYRNLISDALFFFHFCGIENVIDLDLKSIPITLKVHLKLKHNIVLYRKSSNNKFHIVTDGDVCKTCQIYSDYKFWNTNIQTKYLFLFNQKKEKKAGFWKTSLTNEEPSTSHHFRSLQFFKENSFEQFIYQLFLIQTSQVNGYFISFHRNDSQDHFFGIFESIYDVCLTASQYSIKKIRIFEYTSITDFKNNLVKNIIHSENTHYDYCRDCQIPVYDCEHNIEDIEADFDAEIDPLWL